MVKLALSISFLSLISLYFIYTAYLDSQIKYLSGSLPPDAQGGGAGSCRMSFMSPSYFKLNGFGREYTRLGSGPWAIYLYREAGWDQEERNFGNGNSISLSGSPVVFVPGNAGSFRQVRSLASAASRLFWEAPGVKRKGIGGKGVTSLDFFALDFNEDFSAFHGQTLLDQSEYLADAIRYILTLYPKQNGPDPASVIVVAHSMGGIVARAAFLHPHYQAHSISTLITIATPHVVPPVTVDRGVGKVYKAINNYWRIGYGLQPSKEKAGKAREELLDLVTISISGGLSDVTIASEATSLASLLPTGDINGFTVFTTSIPGLLTPIDHLAMLWCQQLVTILADTLLSIVDARVATGVVGRSERMKIFSKKLLGTLESGKQALSGRKLSFGTLVGDAHRITLTRGEQLAIQSDYRLERKAYILPIPPIKTYHSALTFNLITSSTIIRSQDSQIEVYACSRAVPEDLDDCIALFPTHVTYIPQSLHSMVSPILPTSLGEGAMGLLAIDVAEMENQHSIVVVVKAGDAWVIGEFGDKQSRVHVVEKSVTQLLLSGYKLDSFPSTPSLISELWIPALDTSLWTFKLKLFRSACQDSTALFAPMIRQYSPLIHESKFFPNVRVASLYTHASGPFMPSITSPFVAPGSRLQFFLDPTCARGVSNDVAIELTVDIWASLGSLIMRYRMAAVAFPFSLVALIVARQLMDYDNGGPFIEFSSAFITFIRTTLLPLLGLLFATSVFQSIAVGTHLSPTELLDSVELGTYQSITHAPEWLSDLLVGNQSPSLSLLASFIAFACVGIVAVEYLVLNGLIWAAASIVIFCTPKVSTSSVPEPTKPLWHSRVISILGLTLLVLFFAPYQFAFIVTFLVQFITTTKSFILAQDSSIPTTKKRLWNKFHYNFSILLIMFCLLPINALILVVWVRNLTVGWFSPFSSDHNVLSVLGFLVNVESLHSGKSLGRFKNSIKSKITISIIYATSAYGFFWGLRWTENIFPLVNLLFLWLAILSCDALVASATSEEVTVKRRDSSPTKRVVNLEK